jgi:hypothetical protein
VFQAVIRVALYPRRFWPPTHISKYDTETNPDHWLEDYHLAMRVGGSNNDFTFQYLPLLLSSSTRAWLKQLEPDSIRYWGNLHSVFVGYFQGTYTRPGNSWDLHNCRQRVDETLREYI